MAEKTTEETRTKPSWSPGKDIAPSSLSRRAFAKASAFLLLRSPHGMASLLQPLPGKREGEFVLRIPTGNPYFAWPPTLLSYPIASPALAGGSVLQCIETNESLPFQIASPSEPHESASILFIAGLPAGATRTFRLIPGFPAPSKATIKVTAEPSRIAIDAGPIRVRIPATQTVTGEASGPILQLARAADPNRWIGSSRFILKDDAIASITTEQIEAGPLRSTHRLTYRTRSGLRYVATIQCFAGMDFIRLHEDMEAFPETQAGQFVFTWTGCQFDFRQAPDHPYQFPERSRPIYDQYPWERIAPESMNTQFGVSPGIDAAGRLPFVLRLFEPWADVLAASFANFWSEQSSDAAALFLDRMEQWEDHEYAIWHSSPKIAVEFRYTAPDLHFVYKLVRGTRSSCISFYDHARDVEAMHQLEQDALGIRQNGEIFSTGIFPTSHALVQQNWQGTLSLDKLKDWSLTYADTALRPKPLFKVCEWATPAAFYKAVTTSGFLSQLALSGVRQNHGFGPTSSRQLLDSWIPSYQIFREALTSDQQARIEAILLLLAYVHAGEDYMPLARTLSGHPNFLSDVKSTPCGMAFLFPTHPEADLWADQYEAYLRLNTRYHTRPAVAAWDARGGRWTENLGTYVWAFLRPASRAAFLLKQRDGVERLCTPQLAALGDWLVNALSAPFAGENIAVMQRLDNDAARNEGARRHNWGIVRASDGPRRVHPPIGAHAERRKTPRTMWYLGASLRNFSPLIAEHLMWAARPTDQDMEIPLGAPDPYAVMYPSADNRGTNPHLCSAKYTGYGITLRASVDTPSEISVHLLQIDDGPNYRWGIAGEGACGIVYFFANGKGFSHNGSEDVGDRIDQDTDFGSTFGVWKNGAFRSIGQNVLTEPLLDLGLAQYARILPRRDPHAYSWPEYQSRSLLLAGDDYFLLHDRVFNPQIAHRFSWFVRRGDAFPTIIPLPPVHQPREFTTIETPESSGRWIDGSGDSLVLITHRDSIQADPTPFGARVHLADGIDFVIATAEAIDFNEDSLTFTGTSALIRRRQTAIAFALFHGTHLAVPGLTLTTSPGLAISAAVPTDPTAPIRGHLSQPTPSTLTVTLPTPNHRFYLNGEFLPITGSAIALPSGSHIWELTQSHPTPPTPTIFRTESTQAGAIIHGTPVPSAASYELQISPDNAATWNPAAQSPTPTIPLSGLSDGAKYHVRLRARNASQTSPWSPEYPLYITTAPPSPPDGLRLELSSGAATLTWGEVLGATAYRLSRKRPGEPTFTPVYTGLERTWQDHDPRFTPATRPPLAPTPNPFICEYRVTTLTHIGESQPSRPATSNPSSWRTWNPTPGEPFRRTVERTEGELPNDHLGRYYPA